MGKVVGTSTPTSKVTPDLLAAAVEVKERCDREVLLPMLEMNEHIRGRKKELAIMFENMVGKLKVLRETVHKLNKKTHVLQEKAETVQSNAKSLAQRSASVLQSSNDLLPTITQSEYNYFQELKRLDTKTKVWNEELNKQRSRVLALQESVKKRKEQLQEEYANAMKTPRSSRKYGSRATPKTTTTPKMTPKMTPKTTTTPISTSYATPSTPYSTGKVPPLPPPDDDRLELSSEIMPKFMRSAQAVHLHMRFPDSALSSL